MCIRDSAYREELTDEALLALLMESGTQFYRSVHNTPDNKLCYPDGTSVFIRSHVAFTSISADRWGKGVRVSSGNVFDKNASEVDIHTFNLWTDKNTKLDTNGALAPSSPTIDLYSDRIETNSDGEKMNPEFIRNGVGDYTIKNTTGLRENDGWYIKIPNDMNGNPKVAVTLDDTDGVITLKTYARIFDMTTFKFVPDLDQPLDIPDGRWIDLRFNDLLADDEPV